MAERLRVGGKGSVTRQWYARRSGVIRGPFNEEEITRYLLQGRICLADELSQDRVIWRLANSCIQLLPSELKNLSSWNDYQKLVIARLQVDERKGERRCRHSRDIQPERRAFIERRGRDNDRLVSQYLFGDTDSTGTHNNQKSNLRPLLLTLLLLTIVYAWLLPSPR
jgi:hypothetical protein